MRERGVKLLVRGDCREILDSQCDFPLYIRESIQNYPEFDFSHIQKHLEQYGEFFVAHNLENEQYKQRLIEVSKQERGSLRETGQAFLDVLKEALLKGERVEKNCHVYSRVQRAKEDIRQFISENQVKDGELVIVAHSRFSKAFTAKGFDHEKGDFVDYYAPKNCEVFEVEL